MDQFRICINKKQILFAAAHFITFGEGTAESLHGHNYRAGVSLAGPLDAHHLVFDFVRLKRELEQVVLDLDHRTLLAAGNASLPVETTSGEVVVRAGERRYVFPATDVVILDVPNTTAEMLAAWIADRLLERLGPDAEGLTEIEVEVEESDGQSAFCRRALPG
jgi:6-pyruvoyltetrahydropterin/6-carboxytetrahydropterin synthase